MPRYTKDNMPDWLKRKIRERNELKETWLDGPATVPAIAKADGHYMLLIHRPDFPDTFAFYHRSHDAIKFLADTIKLLDQTISYAIYNGDIELERWIVE